MDLRNSDLDFFSPLRGKFVSVIVPVFNEGKKILKNLELLVSELNPYFSSYEIIVISDGSTDNTNEVLQDGKLAGVRTIFLEKNRGKGHAVRQGFREANGDYILFIDGGMELHPKDIRVFLALLILYEVDIVIGSKRHPQSEVEYPVLRRILSFTYQKLIKLLFDLDVTDTQVGLKLFRRRVIDAVEPHLSVDTYGFDLELLALSKACGFNKMLEAPIRLDYFEKNQRPRLLEFVHVFKVGWFILMDTVKIYIKIKTLKRMLPGINNG